MVDPNSFSGIDAAIHDDKLPSRMNGLSQESANTNGTAGPNGPTPSSSSNRVPEQSGEVFIGPGAKKEAEIVGFGLGSLSANQLEDLELAQKYAMDQSIKYVMEKQRQAHQQQQQKISLYSQALALMSRIYVGSINFDVYEDQIRTAFSVYGPVKNINMSLDPATGSHKGFCFLEYEIPEAAQLAKELMNGRFLGGRTIKVMPVGRQDSMPQAQPIIDMVINDARKYNRIYVASVHPDISEKDLRSVFSAFGEITKCQLARHPSGKKHRGFGYIDFTTAESVKEAIKGMNGFDLGGQFLQVGRCVTPPDAINYLSAGATSSAFPAASAIAAAEATAKIHAQEVLGNGNGKSSSPGASPNPSGSSPAADERASLTAAPTQPSSTGAAPARRRGFGGFAAATVPPPAVVQPLSTPPQLAALPANLAGSSEVRAPALLAPQLVIPKLGAAAPLVTAAPKQTMAEASAQQEDGSMDAFYSILQDDKFAPPKLVTPYLMSAQQTTTKPQQQQPKPKVTTPFALPAPGSTTTMNQYQADPSPTKKQKKEKSSKLNLLDRIGVKAKSKSDGFDPSKPANFAPMPSHLAPKDPNAMDEDESGPQLAIGGPESWTALALRDGGTVAQTATDAAKNKQKGGKGDPNAPKRKGKGKRPKITSGPKLNTATKIAAANLAGALSDQLQTNKDEKGEEATLASQEHVQIRGNDARHLLIQKLMRTNRSSVIMLKNMITPEGVDEFLEEEIREECQKYGRVTDVVIVQEEDSGTVKIFVRFAEPVQAEEARKAIDGRFFDGRTVIAQSYDQVLFDHDDFTG